jgi:hypothetical protein
MKKYKMNDEEREVYDNLPSKDKKMYANMTHKQRKRYSKMSGKPAKSYMYACMTENKDYTGKDLMNEMLGMVNEEGKELSHLNSNFKERDHFCKYCAMGFVSDEEKEKHQKTCAASL